ncbi:interference hedgehog isoform X2 [Leptinotarsa decemlineata]
MESVHTVAIVAITLVVFVEMVSSDTSYIVSESEPISLPKGFETLLTCETEIDPDKFEWKFYPTDDPYNPNAYVDLTNGSFHMVSPSRFKTVGKNKSALSLQVNTANAGDYQCLAYYGAFVVASVPWRVTVATLGNFPKQPSADAVVSVGNTVLWRCFPPDSNPEVFVEYYRRGEIVSTAYPQAKSLILADVREDSSGVYTCRATNTMEYVNSSTQFSLQVVDSAPVRAPYFVVEPRRTYTFLKGETALLECAAVGSPVPKVVWFKKNGQLPKNRIEMLSGGLRIKDITASDDGEYVCNYTNPYGTVSHHITLVYHEEPTIDCLTNVTDPKQGDFLDLHCVVKGVPEPRFSWFLNGFSVANDSLVETVESRINFSRIEKRHAGNLQLFARNSVKTVYSSIYLRVIPLVSTDSENMSVRPHHRHRGKGNSHRKPVKHSKPLQMIPPSKPVVSRLRDDSVNVRWSVPSDTGLPISFFKVQYKELGPANSDNSNKRIRSSWKTTNADIPPNLTSFDVENLKPDHIYRFRIAAAYSNNDNKLSANSDKFHLKHLDFDMKNPLPIPLITHTETVNTTSVKIHWKYEKSENVSVEGFYISFQSASTAGDYMKATVDGENTTEYILSHLQPGTIYDIKLQSFNSKFAGEFSPIMKARTEANQSQFTTTLLPIVSTPGGDKQEFNVYVIVAVVVIGCALLICGITLVVVCRKWQQRKSVDNQDKPGTDDHHIQVDGNEYVVSPKSMPKSNGLPPNRITITANPLADADNKNQNMIEMSCLTAQNNNCASSQQESSSSAQESPDNSKNKSSRNKDKNKHKKPPSSENLSSGENYV